MWYKYSWRETIRAERKTFRGCSRHMEWRRQTPQTEKKKVGGFFFFLLFFTWETSPVRSMWHRRHKSNVVCESTTAARAGRDLALPTWSRFDKWIFLQAQHRRRFHHLSQCERDVLMFEREKKSIAWISRSSVHETRWLIIPAMRILRNHIVDWKCARMLFRPKTWFSTSVSSCLKWLHGPRLLHSCYYLTCKHNYLW